MLRKIITFSCMIITFPKAIHSGNIKKNNEILLKGLVLI